MRIASGKSPAPPRIVAINLRFTVTAMLLDVNKRRTYKNVTATREIEMLTFVKDMMAFAALIGFTGATITWMDMASRLV